MKNKIIELTPEVCEHLVNVGETFDIQVLIVENIKDKKTVVLRPSKENQLYTFKPVILNHKQLSEFLDSVKIDLYNLCNHIGYIRATQMNKFSTRPALKCS